MQEATGKSQRRIRSSAICLRDNHILALKYQEPLTGEFWGVPGGEIESGETPLEAAIRETYEETGYNVELIHDPELVIEYDFAWKDTLFHCRTHWFCVQPKRNTIHTPHAGDEEYIIELRWIPVDQWGSLFENYPVIQEAIEALIDQMEGKGLIYR